MTFRKHGFTLIEMLIASGIVSVLVVMISIIMVNVTNVVWLHEENKSNETRMMLNDINDWINDVDNISLIDPSKFTHEGIAFDINDQIKSFVPFLLHEDNLVGNMRVKDNRFGVGFGDDTAKRKALTKRIILSNNAKAVYLRPVYTVNAKEYTQKNKNIKSWNNNHTMPLRYDSVKKLQNLKKEGKIASVHLVVEENSR